MSLSVNLGKTYRVNEAAVLEFRLMSLRPGARRGALRVTLDPMFVTQDEARRDAQFVLPYPGVSVDALLPFLPNRPGQVMLTELRLTLQPGERCGGVGPWRVDALPVVSVQADGGFLVPPPIPLWQPLALVEGPPASAPVCPAPSTWKLSWEVGGITNVVFACPRTEARIGRGEPGEVEDLDFAFARLPWNENSPENRKIGRDIGKIVCNRDGSVVWQEQAINPTLGAGPLSDGQTLLLAGGVLRLRVRLRRAGQGLPGFPNVQPSPCWAAGDLRYVAFHRQENFEHHEYFLAFGPLVFGSSSECDVTLPGGEPLSGWLYFDRGGRFFYLRNSHANSATPVPLGEGQDIACGAFRIRVRKATYADFLKA